MASNDSSKSHEVEDVNSDGTVGSSGLNGMRLMEGEAQCTGTRGKEGRAVGNLSMLTSY